MGGPSPEEKLRQAIINKITHTFNRYFDSFNKLRKFAFTVLVLIFIGTVALSLISPFKLFPRHKSIAELRRSKLDAALKKASLKNIINNL
jgi:hypothetical protein